MYRYEITFPSHIKGTRRYRFVLGALKFVAKILGVRVVEKN